MVQIRLAQGQDIPQIKKIADADKKMLGFVRRAWLGASIAQGELHVAVLGDEVVGFIRWHKRRDSKITIYDLCVAKSVRRRGVGQQLITALGDNYLQLKCLQGNSACEFYQHLGFEKVGTHTPKGGRRLYKFKRNNVPF